MSRVLVGLTLMTAMTGLTVGQFAVAEVRIYGGPVQAAPGGRYYPPGNYYGSLTIQGGKSRTGKSVETRKVPLDLNPGFIPGNPFTPPGYVPRRYPRSSYLPDDLVGYFSRSALN